MDAQSQICGELFAHKSSQYIPQVSPQMFTPHPTLLYSQVKQSPGALNGGPEPDLWRIFFLHKYSQFIPQVSPQMFTIHPTLLYS